MSHILDALQKVQDEKTAKLKQSTMTAGVLLDLPVRSQSKKQLYLYGSIAVAAVCVAIPVIWSSFKSSKTVSREAVRAVATQNPQISATPPAPPIPPVQPTPIQAALPANVPIQPALPSSSAAKTEEELTNKQNSLQQPQNKPAITTKVLADAIVSSAPEGVKLTGIAWQENHKTRRAVINDTLVGEGSLISGAKVIEIKPDLVRVEKDGLLFDVPLMH